MKKNEVIYYDKTGQRINPGDIIQCDETGKSELVYLLDAPDKGALGILATNPKYLARHPDCDLEYYPLSRNDTARHWLIVAKGVGFKKTQCRDCCS